MERIKMQAVLHEINQYDDNGQPKVFSIGYVKVGATKGFKARVRKGGTIQVDNAERTRGTYNLRERGLIQFVDMDTNQTFNIVSALWTHFNGRRILHWPKASSPEQKPNSSL